jgi:hypothetical protein
MLIGTNVDAVIVFVGVRMRFVESLGAALVVVLDTGVE